jgi:hypothetical protein
MTMLAVSDIHMSVNPRDWYRWGLFDWLEEEVAKRKVECLLLNGDLTEVKDRHPAALVDRMATSLARLGQLCMVIINKGNHDYLDPAVPFFGFADLILGVTFVREPTELELPIVGAHDRCLFLPSSTAPEEEWKELRPALRDYAFIFCHQTFKGCILDNGTKSPNGVGTDFFKGYRGRVYSGDIHVPQDVGTVRYIGAPYRIDFGDSYTPRALLIGDKDVSLRYPCPNKHLLEATYPEPVSTLVGREKIAKGDQVKVRVNMRRADYPLWPKLRKAIQTLAAQEGWELYGPELRALPEDGSSDAPAPPKRASPEELVRAFGEASGADADLVAVGLEIAKAAQL